MATLDVLTHGFAFVSDQGGFGFSSVSLLTIGKNHILVDTGPPSRRPQLLQALRAKGLSPEEIDAVIITHMHWDHCLNADLFKNAHVLLHPKEIDYVKSPSRNDFGTASYVADMLEKLDVNPVSNGDKVFEGVSVIDTPGHTKGHISVLVDVRGETILITGDALPDTGTVKRGLPYNIFWDVREASDSVEKMLDASKIFYPGHDRPFKLDGEEISYIQGPSDVEISDSNEGGSAISLTYKVSSHRHINIDMVQKD